MPRHKLFVMDMRFNITKRRHNKFEPIIHVWKLKEEQTCEEYKSMVRDKVQQEEWKHLDVNEHWHKMKKIIMETAQHIGAVSKGPCRHKETCWCNEIAESVRQKGREKTQQKCRQSAKRVIFSAKEKKQKERACYLNQPEHQTEIFRMAKQMVKERQHM